MISRLLLVLALAATAFGQSSEFERFLVPIHLLGPAQGAFGSRWVSELRILNRGPEEAVIENYGIFCGASLCFPEPIPPLVSVPGNRVRLQILSPIPGVVLFAHRATAGQFVFTSRVRDTSRAAEAWGAWLPVVHESEQVRGPVHLLDVPVDPAYRLTLRVYSLDLGLNRSVRVRLYEARDFNGALTPEPDALLGELSLSLRFESDSKPLYAEFAELSSTGTVAGHPRIWIAVEPDGPFGIWAMVSVTNNVTQEVTMILPQAGR